MSATTPAARFTTAAAVADGFDLDGPPQARWRAPAPFQPLDIRPGRIVMIGAPPAAGKTTLTMQLAAGLIDLTPGLKAVVGNVEMTPEDLYAKLLARLANVDVGLIQDRAYTAGQRGRLAAARDANRGTLERLAFLAPPFTVANLHAAMSEFGARLAVIDYAQRFAAGAAEERQGIDLLMGQVRGLAMCGAAVVIVSSVARQKSPGGSSGYAGLTMASFRGSSELEFGADSAYILDAAAGGVATLRCCKNRFGRPADIHLRFDGPTQSFTAGDPLDAFDAAPPAAHKVRKANKEKGGPA